MHRRVPQPLLQLALPVQRWLCGCQAYACQFVLEKKCPHQIGHLVAGSDDIEVQDVFADEVRYYVLVQGQEPEAIGDAGGQCVQRICPFREDEIPVVKPPHLYLGAAQIPVVPGAWFRGSVSGLEVYDVVLQGNDPAVPPAGHKPESPDLIVVQVVPDVVLVVEGGPQQLADRQVDLLVRLEIVVHLGIEPGVLVYELQNPGPCGLD